MIKSISVKIFAAIMAIWAAWSLGSLAAGLQQAAAEDAALQTALDETQDALDQLRRWDMEDHLRSLGYIYRGDIVFFDGG